MQACSIEGCAREAKVRGFCKSHYTRHRRSEAIPVDKREGNELYAVWCSKRKDRVLEWDSFDRFKKDVGEKPEGHRLRKLDKSKPFGPTNVEWHLTFTPKHEGELTKDYVSRVAYTHKLRIKYGLTLDQYAAMSEAQSHSCPICKRHVSTITKNKLVVDHCHTSGKVRALLCSPCNSAIGLLGEDIARILSAAEYLKSHHEVKNGFQAEDDDRPQT